MKKQDRSKKRIIEMMPVKEHLSQAEALAYLDMSIGTLNKIISEGSLTVLEIGGKRYFKLEEIKGLFTVVLTKSELMGV